MNDYKDDVPSVSPEVTFIDDLVLNIENGKMVLPEFQRPYVWKKNDIRDLFDSIYKGYPIGSVLLWDGGGKDIPYIESIGGRYIGQSVGDKYYIVDGQQRLTTLFCCLSDDIDDDDGKWDLYFNLNEEEFTHSINKNASKGCYLSIRSIRKTTSFLKEARRIIEETGDDKLVEKAEFLADRIRKYKMAIIKLDGGTLSEVVEVFSRLNSLGKNIKQQDLIYALTYSGSDKNRVNDFINKVKECFANYIEVEKSSGDIYLQLIKTAIGLEVYDKDRNKIVERLKYIDENEPYKLDDIIKSLDRTLNYLVNVLSINSISLLPYTHQLFMVFHYFHSGEEFNSIEVMKYWLFIVSVFRIGSASPSKREEVIDFFKLGMQKNNMSRQLENILSAEVIPQLTGDYTAGSASGKTVSIILNNYYSSVFCERGINANINDFSVFPPKNMFGHKYSRLGGKIFYTKNHAVDVNDYVFDIIDEHIPTDAFLNSDLNRDEIIFRREKIIQRIYTDFTQDILLKLQKIYLI
ncbi:DUF262 domain-containing protein [Klebsiella sp. BA397-4A_EMB]|uniref:DUF262 domain-containing protein n=1 Tax=Klebsiella TaxID=570 RepID=UPI000BA3B4FF|nr:DUF262 domain-containing protein [Klebsiella pneumoniae]PAB50873.1 hypothetical protein CCZ31_00330 [Klebsiella pneumoniae]